MLRQLLGFSTIPDALLHRPATRRILAQAVGQTRRHATMKVYTKTGDKGTSQLYNGERRSKDDLVFDALGATDELNSQIGLAREHCGASLEELSETLEEIMSRLFDVGSAVATPLDSSPDSKLKRAAFDDSHVERLEVLIDQMDESLPPLKNFILPSGGLCAAHFHVARTLARRAERRVVPMIRDGHVDTAVGVYLNRLSDFLFVAARYAALRTGHEEKIYKKAKPT